MIKKLQKTLVFTLLSLAPFSLLATDSSTHLEMERLKSLALDVDLKLPAQKNRPEQMLEDTISLKAAAPVRERPPRPLVQADLELESQVLEDFEGERRLPRERRFRSR